MVYGYEERRAEPAVRPAVPEVGFHRQPGHGRRAECLGVAEGSAGGPYPGGTGGPGRGPAVPGETDLHRAARRQVRRRVPGYALAPTPPGTGGDEPRAPGGRRAPGVPGTP